MSLGSIPGKARRVLPTKTLHAHEHPLRAEGLKLSQEQRSTLNSLGKPRVEGVGPPEAS